MLSRKEPHPPGAETEQQASTWVRGMFGRIAPRYDLLNHLLSMNIDRYWRARTVSASRGDSCKSGRASPGCVLRHRRSDAGAGIPIASATVFGSDFCHPMLEVATRQNSECAKLV